MVLNDSDSWEYIQRVLRNAEWTEEQIQNITQDQLELVVSKINKYLRKHAKKSAPQIQAFKAASDSIELLYLKKVEQLAAESPDGMIDPLDLQTAFAECLELKARLHQNIETVMLTKHDKDAAV